jgi:hypothetical protein
MRNERPRIDDARHWRNRQNISRNHRNHFRDAAIASDLIESYLSRRLRTSYACIKIRCVSVAARAYPRSVNAEKEIEADRSTQTLGN